MSVHRRRRHPRAHGNSADLRVRIADDADGVVAADLLDPRRELAERRLGNDEAVRVRRRFGRRIEADFARGAREREVGPLPVHVIVDPKHDHVVRRHEVNLRLVDERIGFGDHRVVGVIPVRVLVRDDHVEAALAGPRDRLERAHERRCNTGDDGVRSTEFESVARRHVAPGHALNRHNGLDPVDDFAGIERGHYNSLQYGSPAEMNRTGTSGTIALSQSAQTCMPGPSLTTRPMEMKPFFTPAKATSWA